MSWPEELGRREAAAQERIAELPAQIEALTALLDRREEVASRLGMAGSA